MRSYQEGGPSCGPGIYKTLRLNSVRFITNPHKFRQDPDAAWREMDANRYDLIIVDEAHHLPASFWQEILDHFSGAKKVFLTATPYKNNKEETICPDLEERIVYRLTRRMAEER